MFEEKRRKTRLAVGILLFSISILWLVLPIQKPPLVIIPDQALPLLISSAIIYLFLTYYYFSGWRTSKTGMFLNIVDSLLISFGIAVAGGIESIFVFFYCPLIIESSLFYGPLTGALTGALSSILAIISSFFYSFYSGNFEINTEHSGILFLLILHPFLGWLIGYIAKEEMERSFKESDLPPFLQEKLTPREIQIIKLIEEGKTNAEIAFALGRSEKTIKNHCSAIYRKLEVASRYELIALLSKIKKGKSLKR